MRKRCAVEKGPHKKKKSHWRRVLHIPINSSCLSVVGNNLVKYCLYMYMLGGEMVLTIQ